MKFIDDISEDYINQLHDTLNSPEFPWYLNKKTVKLSDPILSLASVINEQTKDTQQFTHTFFNEGEPKSGYYGLISEMLTHIERMGYLIDDIIRIKANLLTKDSDYPEDFHHIAHSDTYGEDTVSLLYYVNDSDGDTFFFNEFFDESHENKVEKITLQKRITPKKGNAIFFDSKQFHASSSPKDSDVRIVINYVFKIYSKDETVS